MCVTAELVLRATEDASIRAGDVSGAAPAIAIDAVASAVVANAATATPPSADPDGINIPMAVPFATVAQARS